MHYLRIHPAYYNDFDAGACAWLRELIRRGLIAPGDVDERSILDVSADDLRGYAQCHFFAGIGGWSYALRLAGWPDDKPVWTGSPPCQPFSSAGRQKGQDDARHLAPHFISLVGAARPPMLFGEQVASAAVFGPTPKGNRAGFEGAPPWAWLDDLSDRLEAAHYAVGASDIPAAGVSAFHERQRTFFGAIRLADSDNSGLEGWGQPGSERPAERFIGSSGVAGRLADNSSVRSERSGGSEGNSSATRANSEREERQWVRTEFGSSDGLLGRLADSQSPRRADGSQIDRSGGSVSAKTPEIVGVGDRGPFGGVGDTDSQRHSRLNSLLRQEKLGWNTGNSAQVAGSSENGRMDDRERTGPPDSPWATPDWLFCRDGKWRPVESGTSPLADGVSARVGRLRGYGNAIVPQVAAEFIRAFWEVVEGQTPLPKSSFDPLADI